MAHQKTVLYKECGFHANRKWPTKEQFQHGVQWDFFLNKLQKLV